MKNRGCFVLRSSIRRGCAASRLAIANDLIEDDLAPLVLRHCRQFCQVLPCCCANQQLGSSSWSDMDDRIGVCWVRSDEFVVLLWVDERSVACARRSWGNRVRSAGRVRFAWGWQIHVRGHPDEILLLGGKSLVRRRRGTGRLRNPNGSCSRVALLLV
jgi:hypothetical protein